MNNASKIEFEAKFPKVDHDWMRRQLKAAGATCVQPRRLMRRVNLDFADFRLKQQGGWGRLRDEGDGTVTLSYKQQNTETVDGMHEVNATVASYDDTQAFLKAIGMVVKSYQETYRESWQLDEAEVELDEWPWLDPLVEVEAKNGATVEKVAKQLGLDWSSASFGSITSFYTNQFVVTEDEVNELPAYRFGDPAPWAKR